MPERSYGQSAHLNESSEPPLVQANIIMLVKSNGNRKRRKVESAFAKQLTAALKARNLSQRDCAALIGVAPSVIAGWVAGAVPHDFSLILQLAEKLGEDFQKLLTGKASETVSSRVKEELVRDGYELASAADADFEGLYFVSMRRVRRRTPPTGETK